MLRASIKIAPSILAANFGNLRAEISAVELAGADQIHVDVMDGHFVPNLSMGPVIVEGIRRVTKLPIDVHLMVSKPEMYVEPFARAGSNFLTFHIEVDGRHESIINRIHGEGLRAGVAIKPDTSLDDIRGLLNSVDLILVMSVDPGFGGQDFVESSLGRIQQLRSWLDETKSNADLSVDGGISLQNARDVVTAGANVLVAGSSLFHTVDGAGSALRQLRQVVTKS